MAIVLNALCSSNIVTKIPNTPRRIRCPDDELHNKFRFQCRDAGNSSSGGAVDHTTQPSVGTWYHVVFWYDLPTTTGAIIVNDGTPVTQNFGYDVFASNNPLTFGNVPGIGAFDGQLDSAGLWRKRLSAAEITSLYNNGDGRELC